MSYKKKCLVLGLALVLPMSSHAFFGDILKNVEETIAPASSTQSSNDKKGGIPAAALCVESGDSSDEVMGKLLLGEMAGKMPVDITPYLVGFCTPSNPVQLMAFYLYLTSEGALHARITQTKYAALISIYEEAGVKLSFEKDGFLRSAKTLDKDIKLMGKDRTGGLKSLINEYSKSEGEVTKALDIFAKCFGELEDKYKKKASPILASARTHSISATFFLSRSIYAASKLLDFDKKDLAGGSLSGLAEAAAALWIVTSKGEEISKMLYASAYGIKTISQDIEGIPKPDPSAANKTVQKLRADNGVTLGDFEEFDKEQQKALEKV